MSSISARAIRCTGNGVSSVDWIAFSISAGDSFTPAEKHSSRLHHVVDSLVRTALHQHEVGEFAGRDRAALPVHRQGARAHARAGGDRLQRRQTREHQQFQLAQRRVAVKRSGHSGVGAQRNRNPRIVQALYVFVSAASGSCVRAALRPSPCRPAVSRERRVPTTPAARSVGAAPPLNSYTASVGT